MPNTDANIVDDDDDHDDDDNIRCCWLVAVTILLSHIYASYIKGVYVYFL